MDAETASILCGIFAQDIAVATQFDADEIRRENKCNIAQNILLAIKTQRHPRLERTETEDQAMPKKSQSTSKPAATTKGVRLGKFKFLKNLIAKGTMTKDQIVAAAAAQFPMWDAKLVECGVYSARTQMRKAGENADWLSATPHAAPTAAVATAAASEPDEEAERPHVTQPTAAA